MFICLSICTYMHLYYNSYIYVYITSAAGRSCMASSDPTTVWCEVYIYIYIQPLSIYVYRSIYLYLYICLSIYLSIYIYLYVYYLYVYITSAAGRSCMASSDPTAVRCEVTAWATCGPMGITASCSGAVTQGGSYVHVAYALYTYIHMYTYTYIYIYMLCGAR